MLEVVECSDLVSIGRGLNHTYTILGHHARYVCDGKASNTDCHGCIGHVTAMNAKECYRRGFNGCVHLQHARLQHTQLLVGVCIAIAVPHEAACTLQARSTHVWLLPAH